MMAVPVPTKIATQQRQQRHQSNDAMMTLAGVVAAVPTHGEGSSSSDAMVTATVAPATTRL